LGFKVFNKAGLTEGVGTRRDLKEFYVRRISRRAKANWAFLLFRDDDRFRKRCILHLNLGLER